VQPLTPVFGVPPHVLASLASTRSTPEDIRLLRAGLHSRRLVLLKSLLTQADRHAVPPSVRQRLGRHWRLLECAEAHDPSAAREALAYPAVGNWLMHALSLPDRADFADFLGGFGAVAAAVALRAGAGFRLTLETRQGRLALPGIGVYETRAARVRAVAGPRSLLLTPEHRRGGTVLLAPYSRTTVAGWRALRELPGGGAVLDDLDPYRAGPQPPYFGTGLDSEVVPAPAVGGLWGTDDPVPENRARGARTRDDLTDRVWPARWGAALTLLRSADPERAAEVAALVRAVVPMARRPRSAPSATLQCAPGALLAKLPCTAQELAVVLVHEVQHSKLAVLTDLVPMVAAGSTATRRVAWRPDPRPLGAVLHGAYAHLALADLWQRLSERRGATASARAAARAHSEDYHAQVGPALAALRGSGELTAAGASFTEGMCRRHAELTRRPGRRGYPQARHVAAS
jgi:HEXXH motif-containing protein